MCVSNATKVKEFLQDVPLNVYTTRNNIQDDIDPSELLIPVEVPVNMMVAVRVGMQNNNTVNKIFNEKHTNIIAGTGALQTEKFWLARVIDILDSGTYKLRYFKQQGGTKKWIPGIGKSWYGTCSNASILVAGVNLNEDSTITAASM